MYHWKSEGYIKRQMHRPNDQNNYFSNTVISNYPIWSRNLEYQKGRGGQIDDFEQ